MSSVGTLDDLLGPDPAGADNSGSGQGNQGPNAANAQAGDASAVLAELGNMQQLSERHKQQITGARSEVISLKEQLQQSQAELAAQREAAAQVDQLKTQMAELKGQIQGAIPTLAPPAHPADAGVANAPATPTPQTPSGPPEDWKTLQRELLGYEVEEAKLAQLWQSQQAHAATPGLSATEVQQMMAQRDAQAAQQAAVGNMIAQNFPELNNPNDPFTLRTLQLYQELNSNPATASIYGNSASVTAPDGTKFNAAIVMQAAALARGESTSAHQQSQARQNAPTVGVTGGGRHSAPAPQGDQVISSGFADLLRDPELHAIAAKAGLGQNAREIYGNLKGGISPAVRDSWANQANGSGQGFTGS